MRRVFFFGYGRRLLALGMSLLLKFCIYAVMELGPLRWFGQ